MPNEDAPQQGVYESDYLCIGCQRPLYIQVVSQREICLNSRCRRWPTEYSSVVDAHQEHSPAIYDQLEQQKARIRESIRRCNVASLRRFAHERRRQLAVSFTRTAKMQLSKWHAISELLVLTQQGFPKRLHTTGDENVSTFEWILKAVDDWAHNMRRMEDMTTGRYLLLRRADGRLDPEPFALKYLMSVRVDQHASGIVSDDTRLEELTFEYEHIESATTPHTNPNTEDLADLLEDLWPFTLHFRQALRSHWRTSQLYHYRPQLVDFAALAGYWIASSDDEKTHKIPAEREHDEIAKLDVHLKEYSAGGVTASDFVKRYIDCEEQVPVIVRSPEGWILDKTTLLLFILFLQGEPILVDKDTPGLRQPLLTRMQTRAGHEFEIWLRSVLKDQGFEGPDEPVKLTKAGYEYDLLLLSHARRTVVLADAKYRDVAQSSLTGANLVKDVLLGDHGLLCESKHQDDRLAYFLKNKAQFAKFLGPEHTWTGYQVKSYVVTKSTPLISKYGNTIVVRSNEFLALAGARAT